MEHNKKYLISGFIGLLVIVGGVIFIFPFLRQDEGAQMRDAIVEQAITVSSRGDALIAAEESFQISYLKETNQFLILIKNGPFAEIRQQAEVKFLELVGNDPDTACKLNVVIRAPFFADKQLIGQEFPLSFCPQ